MFPGPISAQDIYKCNGLHGEITYDNYPRPGCRKLTLDPAKKGTTPNLRSGNTNPEPPNYKSSIRKSSEITGTAFAVSNSLLLTNNHVVRDCSRIRTNNPVGVITVKARDKQLDLALLDTTIRFENFARFRQEGPLTGEELMIAGYPLVGILGQDMSVSNGIVSSRKAHEKTPDYFLHTAPTQPGNSGGPMFDQSGLAIGVVVGKLNDLLVARVTGSFPQNVNIGINGASVLQFLKASGVEQKPATNIVHRKGDWIAENAGQFTVLIHCYKD